MFNVVESGHYDCCNSNEVWVLEQSSESAFAMKRCDDDRSSRAARASQQTRDELAVMNGDLEEKS